MRWKLDLCKLWKYLGRLEAYVEFWSPFFEVIGIAIGIVLQQGEVVEPVAFVMVLKN